MCSCAEMLRRTVGCALIACPQGSARLCACVVARSAGSSAGGCSGQMLVCVEMRMRPATMTWLRISASDKVMAASGAASRVSLNPLGV
jgi:hypothetical protein